MTSEMNNKLWGDINRLKREVERLRTPDRPRLIIPSARVHNSVEVKVPNTTNTVIPFDTEILDTDNIHSTASNTGRLTCKTAGLYHIYGHAIWTSNASGIRVLNILLNGSTLLVTVRHTVSGPTNYMIIDTEYPLTVNDYVEFVVYQTSGVTLGIISSFPRSPAFGMAYLGKVA